MSEAKYTRLPTEASNPPSTADQFEDEDEDESSPAQFVEDMGAASSPPMDPRFIQPNPGPLKRIALIVFICFLFWAAVSLRTGSRPIAVDDEE